MCRNVPVPSALVFRLALLAGCTLLLASPTDLRAGSWSGPGGSSIVPPAEVEEVHVVYQRRPTAEFARGTTVELWAGEAASGEVRVVVLGPGTITASAMEIRHSAGGVLAGSAVPIVDRSPPTPFLSERITGAVTLNPELTPGGLYELWVRFPVEDDGPLKVQLRIYETGRVSRIEHTGGALKLGVSADFTVTGQQLENATLDTDALRRETGARLEDIRILDSSPTSLRFRATLGSAGHLALRAAAFYDRNQPSPPAPTDRSRRYRSSGDPDGQGWTVELFPQVASLTPEAAQRGQRVTLLGSSLDATEYLLPGARVIELTPTLGYTGEEAGTGYTSPVERRPDALSYVVPDDAISGSLELAYARPDGFALHRFPLPVALTVLLPPEGESVQNLETGQLVQSSGLDTDALRVHRDEPVRIVGSNLLSPSGSSPTVRMGSRQLEVLDARGDDPGRQRVTVAVPVPDVVVSGTLVVETPAGSWESESLLLIPPPTLEGPIRMSEFRASGAAGSGNGRYRDVTDGTLYRDRVYMIHGRNLRAGLASEGGVEGSLEVAGVTLGPDRMSLSQRGDSIRFALYPEGLGVSADPLGSGPLVYRHAGGESSLGTFRILDPPSALARIELDGDSVVGGERLRGRVLFEPGSPPPDGDWIYMFTEPGDGTSVGPREEIVAGEVPFEIRTSRVQQPRTVTVVGEKDGVRREAELRVVPRPAPRPVTLTLEHPNIVGDNPVTATLRLDRPGEGDPIELSSSDPRLASVPATVEATAETVRFTVRTAAVEERTSVRVTATSGGASVSAALGLSPRSPRLTALRLPADRLTGPTRVQAQLRVANQDRDDRPVVVRLRGTSGLELPSSVTVTGGRASFSVDVPMVVEPTRASIRATSDVGDASAALVIEPLEVRELRVDPQPLRKGQEGTGTLTLKTVVDRDLKVILRARSEVIRVPETVVVPAGRPGVSFPVRSVEVGSTLLEVVLAGSKEVAASTPVQVGG